MEELSSPFHRALAANRDRYNAQFRLARHRSRNLDANAFLKHLQDFVGPIVDAAGGDPVEVTDALVDLSFATNGRMSALLHKILLDQARFLAMEPRRVSVALANALHHLESQPDTRPTAWVSFLFHRSKLVDTVDAFLDLAAVAAWGFGLAALRESALAVAARLHPDLLWAITGSQDVEQVRADPWWTAYPKGLRVVRKLGAFRGFGGTFVRPPTVFLSRGLLHATDGENTWRVYADIHGGALRKTEHATPEVQSPTFTLSRDGVVSLNGESRALPQLAGASSWASFGNTLAVTTPWTHSITFVAQS
ncbi:hypothetical protein AOZ06_41160 [Kibdelosporangium phytohabitans]|uniref:Uncharacterized protein n=2 Tax=Kibdelosporangium phytohabitans TaxID=860235 RepID=A0A0N7F4U7_9PSEU|nr:hypothetical protein AOZ06_41160 [Kibdelosporangium phytohabitans]